ncbi:unnamed protein product [Lathyrus sativus]|nr:unnamed protein product [Lathyrus sativus]CAK8075535.1 unnamed protein product [Lathyrus sativus]
MEPSSSSAIAQQTWELENNIIPMETPAADDSIFHYDEAGQNEFQRDKPWANDPHYFKRVKISALALLEMVVHARSGGTIEVMGLMQGWKVGKCCGMVSFSSWLWLLAFWD